MAESQARNDDEDPDFDGSMLELVADALGFVVGIYELDEDLIYLSAQWSRLTGGPSGASYLPTQAFRACLHPDDATRMSLALAECMRGDSPFFEVGLRVRGSDGLWQSVLMQARVTARDAFGQATRIMAVLFDTSRHLLSAPADDADTQHLHANFEHSLLGMLIGTPEGDILRANPAACRISGYTEQELQARGRDGLLDTADPRLEALLHKRRNVGQSQGVVRLLHKDGHGVEVEVASVLYVDAQGLRRNVICLQQVNASPGLQNELLQARSWLRMRKRCARAIIRSPSPEVLLTEVCKLLCETLDLALAWVGELDPDTLAVQARHRHGPQSDFLDVAWFSADARADEGGGPVGRALRSGRIQVAADLQQEPEAEPWHALVRRHNMPALLALPLTGDDAQPLLLVLHASQHGFFNKQLLDELAELAQEIAFALENLARGTALKESEQRFRSLWESALDAIVILDAQGLIHYANPALARLFGHRIEEVMGRSAGMLFGPGEKLSSDRWLLRTLAESGATRAGRELAGMARRKDGSLFPVDVALSMSNIDGQPRHIAWLRDVSRRHRSEHLLRQQNAILRGIAGGEDLDSSLEAVARLVEEERPGCHCAFLLEAQEDGHAARALAPSLSETAVERAWSKANAAAVTAAGSLAAFAAGQSMPLLRPVLSREQERLAWMWVEGGQASLPESSARVLQMAFDLATLALDARRSEQRIRRLVQSDELTGLANRSAITTALDRALARARRDASRVGLVLIDIDRFKLVNQRFGQQAGDQVLRELSRRLQQAVRKGDLLARWGNDAFLVLMEQVKDDAALTRVADKLQQAMAAPLKAAPGLQLGASIGLCAWPEDGSDRDTLLRRLEIATLTASQRGGAGYFHERAARHDAGPQEADLRQALAGWQFVLHWQPRLDLQRGELCAVEALLRWQHPQLGLLWPESFLPLAHSCGLMPELNRLALQQACRQMRAWQAQERMPPQLVFNLSAEEACNPQLFSWLAQTVQESGLAPGVLQLEVPAAACERLRPDFCHRLDALGVRLALDDAGGQALPLARMSEPGMKGITLDRALVRALLDEDADASLLKALLAAAHALSLTVVAKNVESEAQLEQLRRLCCDQVQGFYWCRPLPAGELAEFMQRQLQTRASAAKLARPLAKPAGQS